jgi:methionine synthase II (cobalamin-independent)
VDRPDAPQAPDAHDPLPLAGVAATGVGSMPGTEPREAATLVAGELPDLPHLVELPARGPGADLVGRAAGLLVDLHVDLQPGGWRLVDRPGRDERRAVAHLSQDLDALEEALQDYAGPVKVQVAGPWTLAAALALPRGEPVLSDSGARRDVATSLAEAVGAHVADLRRRLPAARVVLQLDEPSLPAVLAGHVRSVSGLRAFRPVPEPEAEAALRAVARAAGAPLVLHCCAARPPVALLHRAGAAGLSLDLSTLGPADDEALGTALEAGVALLAGLVPAVDAELSAPAATVVPVRRLWGRLGLAAEELAARVVVTPTCGLAGASPAHARAALASCRAAAQVLVEDPEG